MTSTILTDAINFQNKILIHPTYQYTKQYPQESLGSYSVSNVQGPTTTFQLIPNVMNLSKCKLLGTLYLAAQGADNYTWINVNGFKPITRITVQPQGGPLIMDLNYADRYFDMTARTSYSFNDVQTWDCATPYTIAGGNGSFYEGLIPSNFSAVSDVRLDNTSLAKPGQESAYVMAGGADAAFYLDFKLEFDKIVNSILSLDKDIYCIKIPCLPIVTSLRNTVKKKLVKAEAEVAITW